MINLKRLSYNDLGNLIDIFSENEDTLNPKLVETLEAARIERALRDFDKCRVDTVWGQPIQGFKHITNCGEHYELLKDEPLQIGTLLGLISDIDHGASSGTLLVKVGGIWYQPEGETVWDYHGYYDCTSRGHCDVSINCTHIGVFGVIET